MNVRDLQQADSGTPLEVPPPILFNTWKHHAGALRNRIAEVVCGGEAALAEVGRRMAVLGTKLMDLYTGTLSPREICAKVLEQLRHQGRIDAAVFGAWVEANDGYAQLTLPEDESRWVLRLGDEPTRYVHLHPGRWSPATVRVRANVLKTAFLVLVSAGIHGGDPMDRALINAVRREHLGLSPVGKDPEGELGLGAIIELLRGG
jgi:hypothetical protein